MRALRVGKCYCVKCIMSTLITFVSGVQGGYQVTYRTEQVCGLKGVSVVLPCEYKYSLLGHFMGGEWYKTNVGTVSQHDHSKYPDCSLKIVKLRDQDSGVYRFRFFTFLLYTGAGQQALQV